tara:strand:+ start:32 stop:733 length:702 start_codon:yes stop_codon:yes gene_type:complete
MNELFYLFLIGLFINLVLFGNAIIRKNYSIISDYILFGSLAAVLDIFVEFAGTYNDFWNYNESYYFLFNLIPIELPFMFFTAAVIGKFIHSNLKKVKYNLQLNLLFGILSILGLILYIRSNILMGIDESLLVFTIPLGLWGFNTFKSDLDKSSVITVALFVAILDYFVEVIIISTGSYDYYQGFKLITPLNYFLLTIAFLGLMEKFDKSKSILNNKLIVFITKLFGVKRRLIN